MIKLVTTARTLEAALPYIDINIGQAAATVLLNLIEPQIKDRYPQSEATIELTDPAVAKALIEVMKNIRLDMARIQKSLEQALESCP